MNYIEELKSGDCFVYEHKYFVTTIDFKKNNDRLAISLADGSPKWFKSDSIINKIEIYTLDKANTIIPIQPKIKNDNLSS